MRCIFLLLLSTSWIAFGGCDGVFRRISDISIGGWPVARVQACYAAGKCTLLIAKHRRFPPLTRERLATILGGNGRIVDPSKDPTVNCHGYACSATGVPLPKNAWLNPDESYLVLLQEFFVRVAPPFSGRDFSDFAYNPLVQPGDLVLFTNNRHIQHSAIVVRENGENWVDSKLEEDFVVRTPLTNLVAPYQSDQVHLYRRR